jgi:tRNA splicing ligase
MAAPFIEWPFRPQCFLQFVAGRKPAENAVIEIHNLLARVRRVQDVQPAHLAAIAAAYGLRSLDCLRKHLWDMYEEYLDYCRADGQFSDDDIDGLRHLKTLLGLDRGLQLQDRYWKTFMHRASLETAAQACRV